LKENGVTNHEMRRLVDQLYMMEL